MKPKAILGVLLVLGPVWPAAYALSHVPGDAWYVFPAAFSVGLGVVGLLLLGIYMFAKEMGE